MKIALALVAVVVVIGGFVLFSTSGDDANTNTTTTTIPSANTNATPTVNLNTVTNVSMEVKTDDAIDDTRPTNTTVSDALPSGSATYTEYSSATLADAQQRGRAVLFFHAPWCPFCIEANDDITANLDQLPGDVTVLKTDYDTETSLKSQYGVTYQHTFVQVDANGDELTQWTGGGVDELLENII